MIIFTGAAVEATESTVIWKWCFGSMPQLRFALSPPFGQDRRCTYLQVHDALALYGF